MTEQSRQEQVPASSSALEPTSVVPPMQLLAEQLVAAARSSGVELTGTDGLLTGLTKQVLEIALQVELAEHLGYDRHDPLGRLSGNSRNGFTPKDGPHRYR
jgi:putative transposase